MWLLLLACTADKLPTESPPAASGRSCGDGSPTALQACVEQDRIAEDLAFIAQERPPGSAHWQAVQDLCAERLGALGFTVSRHGSGGLVNVIGTRPGATQPAQTVLVSAHYDHIAGCPGADDNASGVAALLEVAAVLATRTHDRTLTLACWDQEEQGLVGSEAWAQEAAARGDSLVGVYVLETMGYTNPTPGAQQIPSGFDLAFPEAYAAVEARGFAGDFLFFAADAAHPAPTQALQAAAAEVGLPLIGAELSDSLKNSKVAADLRRSDHAAFWAVDLPGLFVTDTADFRNPGYHCREAEDTVESLDPAFLRGGAAATAGAAARLLQAGG